MELSEIGAAAKASSLVNDYRTRFRNIEYTLHPRGIPGEAQGKSSNLSWAAQHVTTRYSDPEKQSVIVTVLDGTAYSPSSRNS
jgi:hypothetical protein